MGNQAQIPWEHNAVFHAKTAQSGWIRIANMPVRQHFINPINYLLQCISVSHRYLRLHAEFDHQNNVSSCVLIGFQGLDISMILDNHKYYVLITKGGQTLLPKQLYPRCTTDMRSVLIQELPIQ